MATQQPKKPVGGAYGRFLAEKWAEIVKSLPEGHKITDVPKKASELWKAEANKQMYQELYKAAQDEYNTALEKFKALGGVVARKEKKKDKANKFAKDPNRPKKPACGGYGRFLAEKRAEIIASLPKDHKITDGSKKAGELWKAAPDDEKKKYTELYAEH